MLSKEEVAEIIAYCREHYLPFKSRCVELGIPLWKFYDSKHHYAMQERESGSGEFLQLKSSGGQFVQAPKFDGPHTGGRDRSSGQQPGCMINIELQMPSGASGM